MTRLLILVLFFFSLTALAQKKISELPSLTESQFATGDLFTIVDITGSGTTKKTTVGDLDTRYFRNISVLGTVSGGTGISSFTDGDLLIGSGTTLGKLPRGTQSQFLSTSGTSLVWTNTLSGTTINGESNTITINTSSITSGVLPIARGGTNNGSLAVTSGAVVYTDGSKAVTTTAGVSGQALVSQGSASPLWASIAGLTNPEYVYASAQGTTWSSTANTWVKIPLSLSTSASGVSYPFTSNCLTIQSAGTKPYEIYIEAQFNGNGEGVNLGYTLNGGGQIFDATNMTLSGNAAGTQEQRNRIHVANLTLNDVICAYSFVATNTRTLGQGRMRLHQLN